MSKNDTYQYGNDKIGYHDTRHKAVGAAAIRARKDPFPFGEEFEHRSKTQRRRQILRRCSHLYIRNSKPETDHQEKNGEH